MVTYSMSSSTSLAIDLFSHLSMKLCLKNTETYWPITDYCHRYWYMIKNFIFYRTKLRKQCCGSFIIITFPVEFAVLMQQCHFRQCLITIFEAMQNMCLYSLYSVYIYTQILYVCACKHEYIYSMFKSAHISISEFLTPQYRYQPQIQHQASNR